MKTKTETGWKSIAVHLLILMICASNAQPLYYETKVIQSDGAPTDQFGDYVNVSGDTAVVGVLHDDDYGSASGSAYVFVRNGSFWTEQTKLTASDAGPFSYFGRVAIDGDTIIVGADGGKNNGITSGSAYVFVRSGSSWVEQAKLTPSDPEVADGFGLAVGICGDTVIVGSYQNDDHGSSSGSAYVFVRNQTQWSQQAKLIASDSSAGDQFGISVAINDETVIIGAWEDDEMAFYGSGSAYVFRRNGNIWTEEGKLLGSDSASFDRFGGSVDISGDTVVISAEYDDDDGTTSGSAYVFVRNESVWTQEAKLRANDASEYDRFGGFHNVSIDGNRIVIGAVGNDSLGSDSGAAYLFTRNGTTWVQISKLLGHDTVTGDHFGTRVSIDGELIIIGANGDDDNGSGSGAAYILDTSSCHVTNLQDAGPGSLREAIICANSSAGSNTITFGVSGVIMLSTQLPTINDMTGGTTIDGRTAPGYNTVPVVTIRGFGTDGFWAGLLISSSNNKIYALQIDTVPVGVRIDNYSSGNSVQGCYIGTDGESSFPMGDNTPSNANVLITQFSLNNIIGVDGNGIDDQNEGNVIGSISVNFSDDNVIAGNFIGTDHLGQYALDSFEDSYSGINISGGKRNRIGTDGNGVSDLIERNIIGGHLHGIRVSGSATHDTVIAGNFIGTDMTGAASIANRSGIQVSRATNTIIGTDSDGVADLAERNLISGNLRGCELYNPFGATVFSGNFVGVDVSGEVGLGNIEAGIYVSGGFVTGSRIGTNSDGINDENERNVISGNGFEGIYIAGNNARVSGNFIGLSASGLIAIGNGAGIRVNDGSGNLIGGTALGSGNIIAFNNGFGVGVYGGIENTILKNAIFSNGGLGIDILPSGPNSNDFQDIDTGVNNKQNYPVITRVDLAGSDTIVSGTLHSTPLMTFTIDLYSNSTVDPSGFGEGEIYLGTTSLLTDENGDGSWSLVVPGDVTDSFLSTTATDSLGNTSEFSAPLNSPPVAEGGFDQTVECNSPGGASVIVDGSDSTDPDGSGDITNYEWKEGAVILASGPDPTALVTLSLGLHSIDLTVTDSSGQVDSDSINIVVVDTTGPVPDVAVLADVNGQCFATITEPPTATDNCAGTLTGTTADPLTYTSQGTHTVTWTFDDGNGNTSTQTQTVIVDDATAPVPDAGSLAAVSGECSATITGAPIATDNCAGTLTGTTADPLTYTSQGTHTVSWTFGDGNGNTSTQTQTVIVDDVTAPVPDLASLAAVSGECSATITGAPTATDNCAGSLTGTTADPLTYTSQGTHTVTWIFDDGNGNTSTQTQTVIVDDVTAPVPDAGSLAAVTGECSASITGAPTATDNCAGTLTGTTADPLTYTSQGTHTVTWTFDDGNGNTSTQTQTVIVDDVTAPVPDAGSLAAVTGECSATITGAPIATDNCAGTLTGTTADPVTYISQGTHTVTWTFDDGNGNTSTQTQTVIVDDVTAPVPDAGSLAAVTGECSATITGAPIATDNCAGTLTGTTADPLTYTSQGTHTVTWTFDDGNGNTSTQTQTVIVDDVTAPVPDLASLPAVTGECSATITGAPTATDNCAGTLTGTTADPLTYTSQGTHTVTWTFGDGNGNTSTQTQTVVVDDVTAPVPDAGSLAAVTGECSATITGAPTATDNCAGTLTGTTADPVTYISQGTHTVTWTFGDGNGNTSTQTQTVIVDDLTAPVPDVASLPDVNGQCSATVVSTPTATDNCTGAITGTTTDPLSYSEQGTYLVIWTFDDGNGNSSTQPQAVNVVDTTDPTVTLLTPESGFLESVNTLIPFGATVEESCGLNQSSLVWRFQKFQEPAFTVAVSSSSIIDLGGGVYSVSQDIFFTESGIYSIALTAADDVGNTTTISTIETGGDPLPAFVVIYDPDGGFVSGGGWFNSLAGAYRDDLGLAGKATFGFVSKYKNGTNIPTGNTEFQLQVASFNFHSDEYEWLVVAGHKAMYKGAGFINNAGNYGFLVSAVDEKLTPNTDTDRFRIKIWDKDNGDSLVYDNQIGDWEDAEATSEISGGSIVIHKATGGGSHRYSENERLQSLRATFENFSRAPDDRMQLRFNGMPSMVYTLQTSVDLADWQYRAFVLTDDEGNAGITVGAPNQGRRFYRLELTESATQTESATADDE